MSATAVSGCGPLQDGNAVSAWMDSMMRPVIGSTSECCIGRSVALERTTEKRGMAGSSSCAALVELVNITSSVSSRRATSARARNVVVPASTTTDQPLLTGSAAVLAMAVFSSAAAPPSFGPVAPLPGSAAVSCARRCSHGSRSRWASIISPHGLVISGSVSQDRGNRCGRHRHDGLVRWYKR